MLHAVWFAGYVPLPQPKMQNDWSAEGNPSGQALQSYLSELAPSSSLYLSTGHATHVRLAESDWNFPFGQILQEVLPVPSW